MTERCDLEAPPAIGADAGPGTRTVLDVDRSTADATNTDAPGDGLDRGVVDTTDEPAFRRLLVNTLVSGVTSSFLWFALTFWVYLETKSVIATGIIGGAFGLAGAVVGPAYGTYVDRNRKHTAMMLATTTSVVCFGVAAAVFVAVDTTAVLDLGQPWFWILVAATLLGSVAGNIRSVALSTCVTMLVPAARRDKANGLVGTVTGISFAITSVFSGLVIGLLGMGWALAISVVVTAAALAHLSTIHFVEPEPEPTEADGPRVDVRGAMEAIRAVPGLWMLIALAAFNNLLGGVFLALMDAYGLEMVSVEAWGILWMFLSFAMIGGGLAVSRFGLGPSALRVIILGNLANWTVCTFFAFRSSIVLLTVGMAVWLALVPAIEAAEQTVLQRVIPFQRQGRVFGFAQLVENAASPFTAFLIGPLAQTVVMPFMTDGAGADAIGGWFGTGPQRGLALLFTVAGLIGVVVTIVAWTSRSYRRLASAEREAVVATA
jgi:DHA3 family multidrug efflux protein-like MFS transporter